MLSLILHLSIILYALFIVNLNAILLEFCGFQKPQTVFKLYRNTKIIIIQNVIKMVLPDVETEVQLSITCGFQNNTRHFNINIHSQTLRQLVHEIAAFINMK